MYNHLLDSLIAVVECGSFNKAADVLYKTAPAVMKQLNSLEDHLGIKLIVRKSNGISLTEAGKAIYEDAKFLKDYSEKSIANAKSLAVDTVKTFNVGTSLLNPAKPFVDLWYKLNCNYCDYNLHLVQYQDDSEGILSEIKQLGSKIDFLVGVCDSTDFFQYCDFLQLGRYKKLIGVRRDLPLAHKDKVTLQDLYGYTLLMIPKGDSPANDKIRQELLKHPQIKVEDTKLHYDLSVFNDCAQSDKLLLLTECWTNVHPAIKAVEVDWDFDIPYGIIYAKNPRAEVKEFIEEAREFINRKAPTTFENSRAHTLAQIHKSQQS